MEIAQRSHYASVPTSEPIGRVAGSSPGPLEDQLTAAVWTPNPSADGVQRDLLWLGDPSLVVLVPDLRVAAGESDRLAFKQREEVPVVKPRVSHRSASEWGFKWRSHGFRGSPSTGATPRWRQEPVRDAAALAAVATEPPFARALDGFTCFSHEPK